MREKLTRNIEGRAMGRTPPSLTVEYLQNAVSSAVELLSAENPSLPQDVNERSVAHRLAVHLEKFFAEWNVDCEYNRDQREIKELKGTKECSDQRKEDRINPDIIVHRRGCRGRDNNLLIVEVKKGCSHDKCDHHKLTLATCTSGKYQYRLGLYLNVVDLKKGQFECRWYSDGEVSGPHSVGRTGEA